VINIRDILPDIGQNGLINEFGSVDTLYKSSITDYELYEGNSPSRFYAILLQHGIDQYVAAPS
jgi:hypothetical protein